MKLNGGKTSPLRDAYLRGRGAGLQPCGEASVDLQVRAVDIV